MLAQGNELDVLEDDRDDGNQEMVEEWLKILSRLWVAYGKQPDETLFAMYHDMLMDVPLGLLEDAINRTLREHKYSNVPTIGEVWSSIQKELGTPEGMPFAEAKQVWCNRQFEKRVYRFQ